MKRLPVVITVIALMLMNVFSAAHAHVCAPDNKSVQVIKAVGDFPQSKNIADAVHCAQCSCNHHCNQAFVTKASNSEFFAVSIKSYLWDNTINYSQFSYPPSKPPKV